MDLADWNILCRNKWDFSKLNNLLTTKENSIFQIPIKLQISLIVLRLCLNKIKVLIRDICVIIYNFIIAEIKYFSPKTIVLDPKPIIKMPGGNNIFYPIPKYNLTEHFMIKNQSPISELINFISVGQWCCFGNVRTAHFGNIIRSREFVIFDINYEYQVITTIQRVHDIKKVTPVFIMYDFKEFLLDSICPDIHAFAYKEKINPEIFQQIKLTGHKYN